MLHFAVVCHVIALVAAWLGYGTVVTGAVTIGAAMFVLFAMSTVATYVSALLRNR